MNADKSFQAKFAPDGPSALVGLDGKPVTSGIRPEWENHLVAAFGEDEAKKKIAIIRHLPIPEHQRISDSVLMYEARDYLQEKAPDYLRQIEERQKALREQRKF